MKYIIDIPNVDVSRWVGVTPHGKKLYVPISVEDGNEYNIGTGIYVEEYTEPDRKTIEDEVWGFASMLMNMHHDVAKDIYWSMNGGKGIEVAAEMTYQEAKAKYEAWKREKDKICVGDEVEYECDGIVRFVVFGIVGNTAYGFKYPCDYDDVGDYCDIDMLKKTGRHFDEVEELLKKMGEEK